MVMIALVGGSHVQQVWEGRHLNPPERHLGKPEAPVEERHTGFFLLLLRFLRSCAWCGCRRTRLSACGVMTYRIPRHIGSSPHRSKYLGEEPFYVRLSGAEGEELTAALALCMGGIDLMQPTTPPIRSLYTKAIAQKRKKRRKCSLWVPMSPIGYPG